MARYGLIGKMRSKAGQRDAMVAILSEASAMMEALEDCFLYMVSEDAEDDTLIWVTEVWTSQDAHDASLQMPEVRALISKAMPMIDGAPEGFTIVPVASKLAQ